MKRMLLLLVLGLLPLGLLVAQESDATRGKATVSASREGRPPMAVTPERESAVMTFVERNHPALKEVLASLKHNRPREYEKAVRDIYQTSERLANIKERDPSLYDLELKNWTLRSQIQLLTAHMVMADNEVIRAELRKLLLEQMDVRAEVLRLDRQRARERLERIEGELAKINSDRDKHVEKQIDLLMRSAQQSQPKAKIAGKGEKRAGTKKNKTTVNQSPASKSNQTNQP